MTYAEDLYDISGTKFELRIVADTNDADYITEITIVSEKMIEYIKPICDEIKKCKRHNWPASEYVDGTPGELYPMLTEEQIDIFVELLPYGAVKLDRAFDTVIKSTHCPSPGPRQRRYISDK